MSLGRLVPWASWDEWRETGNWILSDNPTEIRRALDRIAGWSARGRVPLGVESTASFMEARIRDEDGSLPESMLRTQYSLSVVRMVNGISDSSQKGRVASSVASLAANAGLPQLLVDLRHEATHNELPSLSILRRACNHALSWIKSNYWDKQSDHLQACQQRINSLVLQYFSLHLAAVHKAIETSQKNSSNKEIDSDDVNDDTCDDPTAMPSPLTSPLPFNGSPLPVTAMHYDAAKARKQRQTYMNELRALVPRPSADLLIHGFVVCITTILTATTSTQEALIQALQRTLTHVEQTWPHLRLLILEYIAVYSEDTHISDEDRLKKSSPSNNDNNNNNNNNNNDNTCSDTENTVHKEALSILLDAILPPQKSSTEASSSPSIIPTPRVHLTDEIAEHVINRACMHMVENKGLPWITPRKDGTIGCKDDTTNTNTSNNNGASPGSCRVDIYFRNSIQLMERIASYIQNPALQAYYIDAISSIHTCLASLEKNIESESHQSLYDIVGDIAKKRNRLIDSAVTEDDQSRKRKKFARVEQWMPCAIGMFPSLIDPNGRFLNLDYTRGNVAAAANNNNNNSNTEETDEDVKEDTEEEEEEDGEDDNNINNSDDAHEKYIENRYKQNMKSGKKKRHAIDTLCSHTHIHGIIYK